MSFAPFRFVYPQACMSEYTTLQLGGQADTLVDMTSLEEAKQAIAMTRENQMPLTIIGNGSNLLVKDGGIRGLVLRVGASFSGHSLQPQADGGVVITAQAGLSLQRLCRIALEAELTGLEFAYGIPGTVGGAVVMNAGAYGGEMKDVVCAVEALDEQGNIQSYQAEALAFDYRHSIFSDAKAVQVVVSVSVRLQKGDKASIQQTMQTIMAKRQEKQPLQHPSCGSTFKRPSGHFAGALIQEAGLKGYRIGGASVSEKHAGFLVNDQKGTASDYLQLMTFVQAQVEKQTGVLLTPEVKIIGEERTKEV